MFIVYKTTNLINGRMYIGVHDNKDKKDFDGYLGSGSLILKAIKKYGRENFIRETLHTCEDIEDAFLLESEIVTEEFVERKDTYNISTGGKGQPNLGHFTVKHKLGIFSDKYIKERRNEQSKLNLASMSPEKRLNSCKKGGQITGKNCLENKIGIFSDKYRYETVHDISGLLQNGYIWINDGEKEYKYTVKKQESVPIDEYINQNPQYTLGRIYSGCIWYNDGTKNYAYNKRQQETMGINEFIHNNPAYVLGRCRVNFNKQTELKN